MATRMQQRRGTAQQWTDADPILASGEIGFETDTNQFKMGDGVNHWSDLSYFKNLEDLGGSLDDYILLTQKGSANGVATLDNTGKIPSSQIPDLVGLDSEIAASVSDAISTEVTNRNSAIATAKSEAISTASTDATTKANAAESNANDYTDSAISTEVTNRNTAISNAISTEVTNRNSAIATAKSDLENEIATSVADAVDGIVNGAPAALDTLKEISDIIGDSGNIVGSLITNIGNLNTNIAAHETDTIDVHGIADTSQLVTVTRLQTDLSDAVGQLNTTIDNNYAELTQNANDALSAHAADTTGVHGIENTALLATKSYADDAVLAHANDTTNVHGIANFADLASKSYADDKAASARTAAEASAGSALSAHESDTTSIHGISDTANLVYTNDSRLSDERTPSAGSVTAAKIASDAVTTAKILDGNVTTAKIADSAITSAKIADGTIVDGDISTTAAIAQSKISGLSSSLSAKADLAGPTFTGTVVLPSTTSIGNVSATEIGYVDGVTSSIQTQLDAKAPIASPTFTGTVAGITKSMVGLANVDNTSDASKPVSTATQTALDAKAPLASPTFTGTVAGITKSMVGLGNVDNTSDANKPVSTAAQTALDAKLALAGGTMTGALVLSGAPTSDLHAATKAYVDAAVQNVNIHESVVAATTANVNLTNAVDNNKTLDGVTIKTGDRILVKNQSTASQNGIYIVAASGAPTRATDYDAAGEVSAGDFIFVEGGTVNANTGWVQTTHVTTVGTDSLTFTQFSGAGTYTAGTGLTLTGTTFSIDTATTVDLSTAQTLTNKTLTSPTLTTPSLGVATATSINGTTIPSSKTLVTTADSGTVTSTMIADGTIVDADINASAAIAQSKISNLTTDLAAKAPLASPTFTGTVTVSSSGVAFTDGTQTKAGVPSLTTIQQKTASYTLGALTDRDNMIEVSSTSATTVTIPLDSTLNFPVGTSLDILQTNTGQVTIAGAAGVTVNATPGLKLRTQWSSATLTKRAANTWVVTGDLSA